MPARDEGKQWRNVTVRMRMEEAEELERAAGRAYRSISAEVLWRLAEYERMKQVREQRSNGPTP